MSPSFPLGSTSEPAPLIGSSPPTQGKTCSKRATRLNNHTYHTTYCNNIPENNHRYYLTDENLPCSKQHPRSFPLLSPCFPAPPPTHRDGFAPIRRQLQSNRCEEISREHQPLRPAAGDQLWCNQSFQTSFEACTSCDPTQVSQRNLRFVLLRHSGEILAPFQHQSIWPNR